ncbi:Hypothetical protein, putative [Bodo saltans]|uniref:RNA-editing substrate-binding complex 6 protein domain-containing protein n=1 Tax=Bodo saltans TaxID=75058 RepID=A0A0S4ISJ5_BODSA|nr:Hypothetical protein, putative [Bodo saltans]|eukprot:CUE88192.1 Hypothetical protein, putative [Bodo saltans]
MPSANIQRLLARLHVPQVALRATKEELLISLGAVAALRSASTVPTSQPAPPPPPGVLGQRVAKMSWQSSQLKETRILISAASALSWSGAMLPSMYDGICSSLLASSASARANLTAKKNEAPVLVSCIVQTVAEALGEPKGQQQAASPLGGEDGQAEPSFMSSQFMSLTLQHLMYVDLPSLDPTGEIVCALARSKTVGRYHLTVFDVLLSAAQSLTFDAPPAEFLEWLVKVMETLFLPSPQETILPNASVTLASARNIVKHLPESHSTARLKLCDVIERIAATSSETLSAPDASAVAEEPVPLWTALMVPQEPDGQRARLLFQLNKLQKKDASAVTHQSLSSLLKWCGEVDLRDEVAAELLGSMTSTWIKGIQHSEREEELPPQAAGSQAVVAGHKERMMVHELLFFARRSIALRSTSRALEALLADASFVGSDARHQSTALAQLAAPDAALLDWEKGLAPQSSALFTMLNDVHSYSLDQLSIVIFMFPHRTSELQEVFGRVRGKVRDAATQSFDPSGSSDAAPPGDAAADVNSATISGKGLAMLIVGLARCNWSAEPLAEELFLQVVEFATKKIAASSTSLDDVAVVADGIFVTAAPILGHWLSEPASLRVWDAVDELANTVMEAVTPYITLSRGAVAADSCLQGIVRSVGLLIRNSQGRRAKVAMARKLQAATSPSGAAPQTFSDVNGRDEVTVKAFRWFDGIVCDHLCKTLRLHQTQQTGSIEDRNASLKSVASVLDSMLAWDRGHERLLDICAALVNTAWGTLTAAASIDRAIPEPLQQASARVVTLQARFEAPELEMSIEWLLRLYHTNQANVDTLQHPSLTAALIFASVKTGHAPDSTLLVNQLASTSAAVPSVSDLMLEAEATMQTLKLVGNHGYVRQGTFDGQREAIVGHGLDLVERLALNVSAAQQGLSGFASVERISELHARLLTAARLLCNSPSDTNADDSLTSLATRVPFLSSALVSELLTAPVVSTVALATAACERMGTLSWTWHPHEFGRAIFGIGETLRGSTALVHQMALSTAAEHAVDHVELFYQGSVIARMLLGFAKSHITARSLFTVFSTRLKKRPLHAAMSLPDMSCALQAFGIAKFVDKAMFDVLGKRVLAFGKELTPADVMLTACAFSRTMLLHSNLYRGLGDRGAEIMADMPPSAATALISAFGHVGVRHQTLGEAAVTKQKLQELSAVEAAHMLVGLWQMNFDDAGDHFDVLANQIASREGEGMLQKELVGVCSVMHDMKWRHPGLLLAVASRSAQLMSDDAPSITRLDGGAARAVLDTLGAFGVHHAAARVALTETARTVSREAISIPEEERRLLLSGGL